MIAAALTATPWRMPRIRVPEFDPYRAVHVTIPSNEQFVPEVRHLIERVSIPTWLTLDDVAELKLAATEACLNAIRHGSPLGRTNLVSVTVKPKVDQVTVEIRDQGAGFDVTCVRHRPFPLGENGRGIKLIDSLVDSVEFSRTRHGETVRLVKRSSVTSPVR